MSLTYFNLDGLQNPSLPSERLVSRPGTNMRLKRPWADSAEQGLMNSIGGEWPPSKRLRGMDTFNSHFSGGPQPYFQDAPFGSIGSGDGKTSLFMINGSDMVDNIRNVTNTSVLTTDSDFNNIQAEDFGRLLFIREDEKEQFRRHANKPHNFLGLSRVNRDIINGKLTPQQIMTQYRFAGVSQLAITHEASGVRGGIINYIVSGDAVIKNYWEGCRFGYMKGSHLWLAVVKRCDEAAIKDGYNQWCLRPVVVVGPGAPCEEDMNAKCHDSRYGREIEFKYSGHAIQIGVILQAKDLVRTRAKMQPTISTAIGCKHRRPDKVTDKHESMALKRLHRIRISVNIHYH